MTSVPHMVNLRPIQPTVKAAAAQPKHKWLRFGNQKKLLRNPGRNVKTELLEDLEDGLKKFTMASDSEGTLVGIDSDTDSVVKAKEWDEAPQQDDALLVDFADGDTDNPVNFPKWKKWAITLTGSYLCIITTAASSSYNSGFTSMLRDLHTNSILATVGLSMYPLAFGIVPLFTAPLSEEIGRRPMYIIAASTLIIAHVMVALAKNIATVLVGRFFLGAAASAGTLVGGTIADIWLTHERGIPLAIFSFAAIGGTGLGPVAAGWIEADLRFGWRWIQWFHLIAAGILFVATIIFMVETRPAVILTKRAAKLRKSTGNQRYKSKAEVNAITLRQLLYISVTRAPHLLFTEPIVASISAWIGLAWGILFGLIESVAPAFRSIHGFDTGEVGSVFSALVLGALLGVAANFHQEYLYHKGVKTRGPEARLYWPMISAVMFPAGMFIYAWTTYSYVSWVGMAVGLTLFMWATFQIFLASYAYTVDCYGPYASSAVAGQNIFRNLIAAVFPLFTAQYFAALGYQWGNTILGSIALLMMPIPAVLFFYGPEIRRRSPVSRQLMADK